MASEPSVRRTARESGPTLVGRLSRAVPPRRAEASAMFAFLGQSVSRFWLLLFVGWIVLLAATRLAAPPWEDVAQDKEFAFLPADAPSRRSEAMFEKAFP